MCEVYLSLRSINNQFSFGQFEGLLVGPQVASSTLANKIHLLAGTQHPCIYLLTKNYDFFLKHIEPIYLSYLRDRASALRNVGISMIIPFVKCFGDAWVSPFVVKLEEIITK